LDEGEVSKAHEELEARGDLGALAFLDRIVDEGEPKRVPIEDEWLRRVSHL
jgi:hypothetical protein